jgi:hypothetical protein
MADYGDSSDSSEDLPAEGPRADEAEDPGAAKLRFLACSGLRPVSKSKDSGQAAGLVLVVEDYGFPVEPIEDARRAMRAACRLRGGPPAREVNLSARPDLQACYEGAGALLVPAFFVRAPDGSLLSYHGAARPEGLARAWEAARAACPAAAPPPPRLSTRPQTPLRPRT